MARFYFHVRDHGELIHDLEGAEFVDAAAAKKDALQSVRELIAEALRNGDNPDHRVMEIADQHGTTIRKVQFAEVLDRK